MAPQAVTTPNDDLDRTDIQGLVTRGYGSLHAARYLLLGVRNPAAARAYLRQLEVTPASESPKTEAIHVAFTVAGLRKLGVPEPAVLTFSREFLEGMDNPVRSVALSDTPGAWAWGYRGDDRAENDSGIHVLLLCYARDAPGLEKMLARERGKYGDAFEAVRDQTTHVREDKREHFGWKDGISTPILEDSKNAKGPEWTDPIYWGEFVLGYTNEYHRYNERPTAAPEEDPADDLPFTEERDRKDLGKNGTYLVYRQLQQDVRGLWRYLSEHSREPLPTATERAIALGAKMVGRWPSGAPLRIAATEDRPELSAENAFTFKAKTDHDDGDPFGLKCPNGSHVRRANPRDDLPFDHGGGDVTMVRKHQMIRRGRPYGVPFARPLTPENILAHLDHDDPHERGLHFICLVGHIHRQFEFVQRAWINSANFAGLFKDGDPIVGTRRTDDNRNDEFTCPASPVRRKYHGLPQFTTMRGGSYFFLPGLQALKFIARER
jgi:Dyp-type peroxidase family